CVRDSSWYNWDQDFDYW
nr:immunoglobulin heavy chain junction region [Macaca mulatta]MOX63107.1 immunoglobulin heavy chain junction region [Macaca mulatta]MOX63961.1 immunoglobulin heavy chain junction region [Macaca mulatta]MOX64432.1 immunoglobulin heavy chain junction region [Macaca mulatta]MOX64995.1 immunoglobulin heavy chain junction region [Macaca mulatta]